MQFSANYVQVWEHSVRGAANLEKFDGSNGHRRSLVKGSGCTVGRIQIDRRKPKTKPSLHKNLSAVEHLGRNLLC